MADLISRAAAIEICKSIVPNTNPDFYNLRSKAGYGSWMHSNGEVCAITNIDGGIKKLPAVDAAPVVHARWQGVSPFVDTEECSHCRYNIPSDEFETPYCPWCGAIMDL